MKTIVAILVIIPLLVTTGNARDTSSSSHIYSTNNHSLAKLTSTDSSAAISSSDTDKKNLRSLVDELKEKGFHIKQLLKDSRFQIYDDIVKRFKKSAERESPSLDSYKQILGYKNKSEQILDFIHDHEQQLDKAEKEYGISKFVVAAIIGIESDFGMVTGSYNPFNAYVSMYVKNYRTSFAKAQIEALLEFTKRNGIDVFELNSSYAGAMASVQFIPHSLNKWFVGSDIYSMDNNIMSAANYLRYFKERTNSIEKAVLRYNPSSLYQQAVLDLADDAKQKYNSD